MGAASLKKPRLHVILRESLRALGIGPALREIESEIR